MLSIGISCTNKHNTSSIHVRVFPELHVPLTEYRRVWPVEEAGPVRGQQSSILFDSTGQASGRSLWIEEKTFRRFCWSCKRLLRLKGTLNCPKCGSVNTP